MNEGLQINGITLGGNWDTESTLQKELHIGFDGWCFFWFITFLIVEINLFINSRILPHISVI